MESVNTPAGNSPDPERAIFLSVTTCTYDAACAAHARATAAKLGVPMINMPQAYN